MKNQLLTQRKATQYSEEFHLEWSDESVKRIYEHLKNLVHKVDKSYIFNPQKYYISIKGTKNIIFLKIRKKKIRMIVMLPERDIRRNIKNHPIKSLSQPVQDFYNGTCAAVDLDSMDKMKEIDSLIRSAMISVKDA